MYGVKYNIHEMGNKENKWCKCFEQGCFDPPSLILSMCTWY